MKNNRIKRAFCFFVSPSDPRLSRLSLPITSVLISHYSWSRPQFYTEGCTILRQSIPRQIDKKSRVPKEEEGVWGSWSRDRGLEFSKEEKRTNVFISLHSLVLVNYTTQFKLCTKAYMTKMCPAWGLFLLPEGLLANPVILKCDTGRGLWAKKRFHCWRSSLRSDLFGLHIGHPSSEVWYGKDKPPLLFGWLMELKTGLWEAWALLRRCSCTLACSLME